MKKRLVCLGMVVGLGLAACGGGRGDGNNGAPSKVPSGACATCETTADCEDGLICQPCRSNCGGEGSRCAGLDGAGTPTLSCARAAYPGGCANVAGDWNITEEVMASCTGGGETVDVDESGGGTVTFEQRGCDVSYVVPDTGISRAGKIVGNRMRLIGRFLVSTDPRVSFHPNLAVVDGEVSGSNLSATGTGLARTEISGVRISCEGQSTATGFRVR